MGATFGAAEFVEVKAAADAVHGDTVGADETAIAAESEAWSIEVCVRGGRRVRVRRGMDQELLIGTIRVLEGLA